MKKLNFNPCIYPASITMGNLFCGFLAICYIQDKRLVAAAWLVLLAMIFDMFDGKVARLTNGSSDFGVQLDSLADMVSFGIAPAFLIKVFVTDSTFHWSEKIVWAACFGFVACAAWRLAKFNVTTGLDEESHTYFHGLASPAAAGVLVSLVLISEGMFQVLSLQVYNILILFIVSTLALLMISDVRYLHIGSCLLKKRPLLLQILVVGTVLTTLIYHYSSLPFFIFSLFMLYCISGPANEVKLRTNYHNEEFVST